MLSRNVSIFCETLCWVLNNLLWICVTTSLVAFSIVFKVCVHWFFWDEAKLSRDGLKLITCQVCCCTMKNMRRKWFKKSNIWGNVCICPVNFGCLEIVKQHKQQFFLTSVICILIYMISNSVLLYMMVFLLIMLLTHDKKKQAKTCWQYHSIVCVFVCYLRDIDIYRYCTLPSVIFSTQPHSPDL